MHYRLSLTLIVLFAFTSFVNAQPRQIDTPGTTALEISHQYNICFEDLIEANPGLTTWGYVAYEGTKPSAYDINPFIGSIVLPEDAPPCYDENGLRIGHDDRAVHETRANNEWLFEIAQQYEVCLEDLIKANPLLAEPTMLPSLIFIPDTPKCAEAPESVSYTVQAGDTYTSITHMFNICLSSLFEANPDYVANDITLNDRKVTMYYGFYAVALRENDRLKIPLQKRPCYYLGSSTNYDSGYIQPGAIPYICYTQPIDFDADYTGHQPVISPVAAKLAYYNDDVHCYDLNKLNYHFIMDNQIVWFYPAHQDTLPLLTYCLGVPIHEADRTNYTETLSLYDHFIVRNPPRTCPMLTGTPEERDRWKADATYYLDQHAGEIDAEGQYTVKSGDTLWSIGRRYGYLPDWIAAENGLNREIIYPYERLRIPRYPGFYHIGLATVGILLGAVIVRRVRKR